MRRFWAGLATVLGVWVIASCSDITAPPTVESFAKTAASPGLVTPGTCTTYDELKALTVTVYGTVPNAEAALSKLDKVRDRVTAGSFAEAKHKALDLAGFILKERKGKRTLPGTEPQIATLVNKLLCYVGMTQTVGDPVNAFAVTTGDPVQPLVTSDGNAGVVIGGDAVTEPTIITIAPIPYPTTYPGAGPLHTKLDQYPGYYYINKISATDAPLLKPVIVAVCPAAEVSVTIRSRMRLGHDATAGFELTRSADGSFLTCPVAGPSLRSASIAASEGESVSKVGQQTGPLAILAATGGVGGTTVEFSPFGTVDPLVTATGGVGGTTVEFIRANSQGDISIVGGQQSVAAPCTEAVVGTSVDAACRPMVTIKTPLGTALQGALVTFSVTQGGGQIATAEECSNWTSSLTILSGTNGKARVCWKLGTSEGTNTVTATAATGGDVPAGATYTYSPATLSWSMAAVRAPDTSAPVVGDPIITGDKGTNDWYTSDVTVTWTATDPESGIKSLSPGCSSSVTTNTAGAELTCVATNGTGLTTQRTVTIKRDAALPTVAGSAGGTPGANDWYTSDVSVNWSVTGGISDIASRSGECAVSSVALDGPFSYTCTVTSGAGRSASATVSGKRDASAPEIPEPLIGGATGLNGWYTSDVSVGFRPTDNVSGITTIADGCRSLVAEDTRGTDVVCYAINGAGLRSERKVSIKRDALVPSVTGVATGTVGRDSWFTSDVSIAWTVSVGVSGIGAQGPDCSVTSVVNDGAFTYACTVSSGAGLSGVALVSGKRDASPPMLSAPVISGTPGRDGWYTSDVGVTWSSSDRESGIISPECAASVTTDTSGRELTCTATNGAGLSSQSRVTIKRDASPPVIADPVITGDRGENEWYTSDVRVSWGSSDAESGIISPGCVSSVTSDTRGTELTCTATNGAGTSSHRSITIKRDASAPVIADPVVTGHEGTNGWYTTDVNVSWGTSDAESGIVSPECKASVITDTEGTKLKCVAKNEAGLSSEQSITIKRDAVKPVVSGIPTGTSGDSEWFTSDVAIAWTKTVGISGMGPESSDCSISKVTTDGSFALRCEVTSGAGLSGAGSVSGKRDATVPVVTASVTGLPGNNNWYVGDVAIVWANTTGPSGVGSQSAGCSVTSVTTDGEFSPDCAVTSGAGLTGHLATTVKRDATRPVVTYSGALSYTVSDNVSITCTASDLTSGIASTTCVNVTGPAYNFIIGDNPKSATAVDKAGNTGDGSVTFRVAATYSSVCALTKRFASSSTIAGSMCSKLDAASRAELRGSMQAKSGNLSAYVNEVSAQSGKSLSAANATLLIQLAGKL